MIDRYQLRTACERLFRRTGGSTDRSAPFAELPAAMQAHIQNVVAFVEPELPIVASFSSNDSWVVATTDRVVFRTGESVTAIPLAHLREVHSLLLEDGNTSRDDVIVLTTDTQRYEISVERGYALSGLWNVLRRLCRAWAANA